MRDWADYSVIPSDRLCHYMDKYVHFHQDRIRIVPHVALTDKPHNKRVDGKLRMLVSGNNRSPRDPRLLLNAFMRVVSTSVLDAELVFVGSVDDDIKSLIIALKANSYIKILPAVSYEESMDMLKDYDLAILIEAPCDEGIFLPTKIVDFMQVRIPVFAISPKVGILNDLYKKGNIGYFADCTDEQAIENELKKIISDYNIKLYSSNLPKSCEPCDVVKAYNEMIY